MEKKRIKYIILGFVFLGIGIVLANLFMNYIRFSIIEYILSCVGLILLIIAPFLIFKSKPSKYLLLSLLISFAAYIIIIILFVFRSNLPNYFEEIGVAIFGILIFLAAIFSIISAGSRFKELICSFKKKD